jgi:molybdate/tungstate transport system substrate-binding protein
MNPLRSGKFALLSLAVTTLAATAGCGSSAAAPAASSTVSARPSGTANVAYASSLESLNQNVAGPTFNAAEGYKYSGQGNPPEALEAAIAAGKITPNVFESIGSDDITPLEPKLTKWYIQYAETQVVLAYNPDSRYASEFQAIADGAAPTEDLFMLLETSHLKLGRTDPVTDSQGRDFIFMLELAQKYYNLPSDAISKILRTSSADLGSSRSSQIFTESSLGTALESGQLDAASVFINQAVQLHLDYIKLPELINLSSPADDAYYEQASLTIGGKTYTGSPQVIDITIIGTPTAAATAFVMYTLSQTGLTEYRNVGFAVLAPKAFGDTSAIPASITSELDT